MVRPSTALESVLGIETCLPQDMTQHVFQSLRSRSRLYLFKTE